MNDPQYFLRCVRRAGCRLGLLLCIALSSLHAAPVSEYEIKAAFLFNFAHYVVWPPGSQPAAGAPIVIGVVGDDPFRGALDLIVKGETIDGHPLAVRHFAASADIAKCNMLFISRSESAHLRELLDRLKNHPVLTVSDCDRFAYSGGTIGLVIEEGKVRFQINVDRAKIAQLTISSKLLRPATIVRDKPQSMLVPAAPNQRAFLELAVLPESVRPRVRRG